MELIHVKTEHCDYLLQILYDSGSQVSLCNWQCGPLVTVTRRTNRNITITSVNSSDMKVRKIHRHAIGFSMYVEAILIPSLNLKVTDAGIPDCFNR